MSAFSIRLSRKEDAEHFYRVEDDAAQLLRQAPELKGVPIPPTTSVEDHVKAIGYGRSLTALVGDEIVGFAEAGAVRRELHLHELSVSTAHQRKGIGATLLRALKVDAQNSGYRAVTLNTFRDVPWNAPFYARHGFVEVENFEGREYLAESLAGAVALGIPAERRCAMIHFLD